MARPASLSVIIPVKNGEAVIREQLSALAEQTYAGRWEVIVADNGSTDRTNERITELIDRLPRLRIVDASDRPGAGHARNVGAAAASGEYLLFIDADDSVTTTYVERMAVAAEDWDMLCGNTASFYLGRGGTEVAGGSLHELPTNDWGVLPFASGAATGIRADAFRKVGGYNDQYRIGQDIEFSWRVQLAGFTLGFVPDAIVEYRERSDWRELAKQSYRFARAYVQLYRDFRHIGMKRQSVVGTLKHSMRRLILDAPAQWRTEAGRRAWTREVVWLAGCISGSLKYRVVCL
jgi:glycosyltransferase involved in cell wall biosynthesis